MAKKTRKELAKEKAKKRAAFVERVRQLMADGGSYNSVAKKLGVRKGVVSGICFHKGIPSTHTPGFHKGGKTKKPGKKKPSIRKKPPAPVTPPPEPPDELEEELEAPAPPPISDKPPTVVVTNVEAMEEVEGPRPQLAHAGQECTGHWPDGNPCTFKPIESEPARPWLDPDRCKYHQRKK